MALSVTPRFCISSADGFEANVIDHRGTQLINPEKMRLQLHFLCLAYALMSSHISSPSFSVSLPVHLADTFLIEEGKDNLKREGIVDCNRKGEF